MADEAHHELIIVRRHEEEEHEHHSSAWKVAHADFMTAMMAFFLIMWLINVTDDQMRKGISEYFNPIHLSAGSTELKGLNQPDGESEKAKTKKGHTDKAADIVNPLVLSQGNADTPTINEDQKAAAAAAAAAGIASAAGAIGNAGISAADAATNGTAPVAAPIPGNVPGMSAGDAADARERAAFQDPYAVLAKLADRYVTQHAMSVDTVAGDDRQPGVAGGEVDRDPFDPVYWQLTPVPAASADDPGSAATAEAVPPDALPDAMGIDATDVVPPAGPAKLDAAPPVEAPKAEASATATAPAAAADAIAPETIAASEAIETAVAKTVAETTAAAPAPDISVTATSEGVLINLTDAAAFSMFAVGSAIPDPEVVVLMDKIAKVLAGEKGDVIVRGFTDGRPFHSQSYDNWRLSAARAHMAYYMLTRGGLEEARVVSIEGHADRNLKNAADPFAAENRRIEIILKRADG